MRVLSGLFLMSLVLSGCTSSEHGHAAKATAFDQPPAWAEQAIWYQILVERFRNGDPANDPTAASIAIPALGIHAPEGWAVTPWGHDWYAPDPWMTGTPVREELALRRYGGDLQGLLDKLDDLQALGVNALYVNPLNDAPSLHKYDAHSYHHIDVHFGPDPDGDRRKMAGENPADPDTWVWTEADRLFLRLVDEVHRRGMRLIMDYSWNHTGTTFWAWQDILKDPTSSPYRDWYEIERTDDPSTPENEFAYKGWLGLASLPETRKTHILGERHRGQPYEGDINAGMKAHIFAVTRRWLAPDGDPVRGVDGFRLDVVDEVGLIFWRDFRQEVRSIKPDAYLVGEVWWAHWPDRLMDPSPYVKGDVFDGVMCYQAYRPARAFFAAVDYPIDADQLKDSLEALWSGMRPETARAMMLTASSHDTPRLVTSFANRGEYKVGANPLENPSYWTRQPLGDTYRRLRMYLLFQFTIPGAPHIWNGEEFGMWGADDPDCRKPVAWPDLPHDPERTGPRGEVQSPPDWVTANHGHWTFYQRLIRIRKEHPALSSGSIRFLVARHDLLVYERQLPEETVAVCFNRNPEPANLTLGKGAWTDLDTGRELPSGTVTLDGLSGRVFSQKQ